MYEGDERVTDASLPAEGADPARWARSRREEAFRVRLRRFFLLRRGGEKKAPSEAPDKAPSEVLGNEPSEAPGKAAGRWRRRGRRAGVVLLVLVVVCTVFSFSYNIATADRAEVPKGLSFVRTGDIQTRYRTWGSAAGTAIVLVPGFLETADTFQPLAAVLASRYRVESYDVRGFGYTDHRGPYTTEAQATQLFDYINARHLTKPVLAGHSNGAGVIARFLLDHPGVAGGVVFIDGDGLSSGVGHPPPSWVVFNPFRTTLMRVAIRSDWVIKEIYSTQCGPACPPLDAAGIQQWRLPLQVGGAESALWTMAEDGPIGVSVGQLATIAAQHLPSAVVFGADDSIFSSNSPELTAQRIGAATPTIIPGARHLSFISNPRQVAAVIESVAVRV